MVTWVNGLSYKSVHGVRRIIGWVWFELLAICASISSRRERPDVVIASSLSLFSVLTGLYYKCFHKSKFIFEVRDIWPQSIIDLKGTSTKHPFVWCLSKLELAGYRYSDGIVGTMPGLHMHVESLCGLGQKVTYIPQPLDLDEFIKSQRQVAQDYIDRYIPKQKFIAMYAGTFGPANALEYFIEAAYLAKSRAPDVSFVLVGSGQLKQELVEQAAGLNNIVFAPPVAKNEVQSVLEQADVLLASVRDKSIYRYGISFNKFIDYMHAEKPSLIMYNGYKTSIEDSGCGVISPAENPDQFVDELISITRKTDDELKAMGARGKKYLIENQSLEELCRVYEEIFT